jgi:hypothetical protein
MLGEIVKAINIFAILMYIVTLLCLLFLPQYLLFQHLNDGLYLYLNN